MCVQAYCFIILAHNWVYPEKWIFTTFTKLQGNPLAKWTVYCPLVNQPPLTIHPSFNHMQAKICFLFFLHIIGYTLQSEFLTTFTKLRENFFIRLLSFGKWAPILHPIMCKQEYDFLLFLHIVGYNLKSEFLTFTERRENSLANRLLFFGEAAPISSSLYQSEPPQWSERPTIILVVRCGWSLVQWS